MKYQKPLTTVEILGIAIQSDFGLQAMVQKLGEIAVSHPDEGKVDKAV